MTSERSEHVRTGERFASRSTRASGLPEGRVSADHAHEPGHDDHHGSPFIQHHYDDAQHQFDSGKLGIWLFLAQEVLFFSALFVAYILYRYHHPEIYDYAHKYLDVKYGAINTAVLIFSSLTAAWAVRAAQLGQRKLLIGCLAATLLCALAFLGIKFIEYSHKHHEQILMGKYFDPCVSSGGGPLLTKSNQCPGHHGSVWYEGNAAQTGCYAESAIDQNINKPGLQLDCQVTSSVLAVKRDEKGPILDKMRRWTFDTKSSKQVPECKGDNPAKPCWTAGFQPAVCRPGFYFSVQCTPGAPCASEAVQFESSPRYAKIDDCEAALNDRRKDIKKRDEAGATGWVAKDCGRSNGVGFIVQYESHDVLEKVKDDKGNIVSQTLAVASCAPPPPPRPAGDVFAAQAQAPKLGEKQAASPGDTAVDPHAAKEAWYHGPPPDNTGMFFTIYFAMTGLHGIHVLFGVFVFIWLLIRAVKGHFTADYFGPIDFAALYWHIVDLIWIFLFPLLYLIH
jgi:heme/copper-type cytochrome/quinol oxidase subunit 3